jgi:hypothetical protein
MFSHLDGVGYKFQNDPTQKQIDQTIPVAWTDYGSSVSTATMQTHCHALTELAGKTTTNAGKPRFLVCVQMNHHGYFSLESQIVMVSLTHLIVIDSSPPQRKPCQLVVSPTKLLLLQLTEKTFLNVSKINQSCHEENYAP